VSPSLVFAKRGYYEDEILSDQKSAVLNSNDFAEEHNPTIITDSGEETTTTVTVDAGGDASQNEREEENKHKKNTDHVIHDDRIASSGSDFRNVAAKATLPVISSASPWDKDGIYAAPSHILLALPEKIMTAAEDEGKNVEKNGSKNGPKSQTASLISYTVSDIVLPNPDIIGISHSGPRVPKIDFWADIFSWGGMRGPLLLLGAVAFMVLTRFFL